VPQLEAIVFDCDGVILESADLKSRAFFTIGEEFGPEIQEKFYEHHLTHTGVSRFEKFAWLYRTHLGREITPAESARLGAMFVELCADAVRRAPFVPGFAEVLDFLDGRLPLFIASGTPQA
jgi:beta-phosphoglucomutase-like phosphatase (HAD superfamily)